MNARSHIHIIFSKYRTFTNTFKRKKRKRTNKRPTRSSRNLPRSHFQRLELGAEIFNAQAWAPKMIPNPKKAPDFYRALPYLFDSKITDFWKSHLTALLRVAHHYKDRSHLRAQSQTRSRTLQNAYPQGTSLTRNDRQARVLGGSKENIYYAKVKQYCQTTLYEVPCLDVSKNKTGLRPQDKGRRWYLYVVP